LGTDFATGHRSVQVFAAQLDDALGKVFRGHGGDGAHVHHDLASAQTGGNAVFAKQRIFHVRGVGHHRDDDVSLTGYFGAVGANGGASFFHAFGEVATGVGKQLMTTFDQVDGHGCAHDAQTN